MKVERKKKVISFRQYKKKNFKCLEQQLLQLATYDWRFLDQIQSPDQRMETFQDVLFKLFEESFPLKTVIIPEDSAPWYNEYLAKLRKKKSREFQKHRKSQKYKALKVLYNKQLKHAKKNYYTQKVERLKSSNSGTDN